MDCPKCKQEMSEKVTIGGVTIEKCAVCGGHWFEGDELRKVKDVRNQYAKWFDFDLWEDPESLKAEETEYTCPIDQEKLFRLNYDNSDIAIEACKKCGGIWLDKDELDEILEYVEEESDLEIIRNYAKKLMEEGKEVFSGSEGVRSEAVDLLLLIKMFQYKFMAEHPTLTKVIMARIPPLTE